MNENEIQRVGQQLAGEAYTSTHSWDFLTDLVDYGSRMPGQQGERAAANLFAETLRDIGVRDVTKTEFDINGWWRGSAALDLTAPLDRSYTADHEVIALPWTVSGSCSTEILDLDHGLPSDFDDADVEGSIVLVSSRTPPDFDHWVHRNTKYGSAVEAGAAGFIFRNHVDGQLPPTGTIRHFDREHDPIPAVGVSKELGKRLSRLCTAGKVTGRISVDCRNEPTTSQNVHGKLGPQTDRELVVGAHIDAHDLGEGALDDGAGLAILTEVARLISTVEDHLDVAVTFVGFGAEEIGHDGAVHWTQANELDDVKCMVNVDEIGQSRSLKVVGNGFLRITETLDELGETLLATIDCSTETKVAGDSWEFLRLGVPTVMAMSRSIEDGRGWGHTHADTLDKVDVRDLRELSFLIAMSVVVLASDDVRIAEKSASEVRAALNETQLLKLREGLARETEARP